MQRQTGVRLILFQAGFLPEAGVITPCAGRRGATGRTNRFRNGCRSTPAYLQWARFLQSGACVRACGLHPVQSVRVQFDHSRTDTVEVFNILHRFSLRTDDGLAVDMESNAVWFITGAHLSLGALIIVPGAILCSKACGFTLMDLSDLYAGIS